MDDLDRIISVISLIAMLASWLTAYLKARRDGKAISEAVTLAINVLKVEEKMNNGAFKQELIEKADVAAEVLQTGERARDEVMQALQMGREVPDLKIGSIKGKPIYLGQIAGVGAALAAALRKLRLINRR